LNALHGGKFKPEQLLTETQNWGVLDYATGAGTHAHGELNFRAGRRGTAHGVCLWFETQLFEAIGYSSGPGAGATIYGQMFLPWLEPVDVVEGQEIQVELNADLVGQDYVWRWETKISEHDGTSAKHFQQSTLEGALFSPQSLQRRVVDHVPVLSEAGQADRWMLQAMDGTLTLQEIARGGAERFPRVFSSWDAAFQRAAELSGKLSR
jgi:protein arginine N-methyltransferase 1